MSGNRSRTRLSMTFRGLARALAKAGGLANLEMQMRYRAICETPDGHRILRTGRNIVPSVGLTYIMEAAFLNAATGDATWFLLLTDGTPTVAIGDTLAVHAGWVEFTNVTESPVRQVATLAAGAAGIINNTGNEAVFTLGAGGGTIGGAGLAAVDTGTSGILASVAAFDEGDVVLPAGSTITVGVVATLANA